MTNTINGTVASQYTYTNDLLGRRTAIGKSGSMMAAEETQPYGYNVRDELISGQAKTYAYDDIGNRTIAEGKTYAANNLNQYTAIDDFTPQYDDDGNQTLIKTETGVWSVVYNAENRPVRWTQGDTVITMAFDRMGRRVDYRETRAGQVVTHFRFVYDNFLCVQRLNAANGNAVRTEFMWDPTEPIATRPLVMRAKNWGLNLFYTHDGNKNVSEVFYHTHDGNKNVSEVFYHALQNGIAAHYDYAPFGAVTRTAHATRVTNRDIFSENPFRFSSEYHDAPLDLVYYNYRHYNPKDGRWLGRDFVFQLNPYEYQGSPSQSDFLGLTSCCTICVYSAIKLTTNLRGPLDIGDGFSGHTWFTIEDNKNGDKSSKDGKPSKSIEFSFGPVPTGNSTKELINGVEGGDWDVGEYKDQTKYALNKRCWTADRETCCALKQEVSDFKENPEEFSAFNYCTSKAIEILRHHNIPVPDGKGEIEIPYFFNISAPNPRDLYIQLGNLPEGLPHISNNNHSTDSPSTGSKKGGSK